MILFQKKNSPLLLLLFLLLFTAGCSAPSTSIQGLWIGSVRTDPDSGSPKEVTTLGNSSCLILRHRNSSLHLLIEGNTDNEEDILLKMNDVNIATPVHSGRFQKRFTFNKEQLGQNSWCRISFSQPGIHIKNFQYSETRTYPKTIVFALDGASWRVLDKMIAQKRLPHFQKLVQTGSSGILESVEESLSPVVWTTIATGKNPEEHGIVHFIDKWRKPVNSKQVRMKRLWNILSDRSPYTTGIMGWYVTFPVEQVAGFMVSDRAFQYSKIKGTQELELSYPPELIQDFEAIQLDRVNRVVEECKQFTSYPFDPMYKKKFRQGTPKRITHELLNKRLFHVYLRDSTYVESGLHFYKAFHPDVFLLYLRGNDYTQHAYWHYMEPEGSFQNPKRKDINYFGKVVENYYSYMDVVIGRYMEVAPPDTTFIVISDHGFRAVKQEEFMPARALSGGHEKEGIYIFKVLESRRVIAMTGYRS